MIYYEINKPFRDLRHGNLGPGLYAQDRYVFNEQILPAIITYQAERIWLEQDNKVKYLKNRNFQDATVDMKEFGWIKLKAKVIK